jgi:hypothetical protein
MSGESREMSRFPAGAIVAGSIPYRQICFLKLALASNLLFNSLSKNQA